MPVSRASTARRPPQAPREWDTDDCLYKDAGFLRPSDFRGSQDYFTTGEEVPEPQPTRPAPYFSHSSPVEHEPPVPRRTKPAAPREVLVERCETSSPSRFTDYPYFQHLQTHPSNDVPRSARSSSASNRRPPSPRRSSTSPLSSSVPPTDARAMQRAWKKKQPALRSDTNYNDIQHLVRTGSAQNVSVSVWANNFRSDAKTKKEPQRKAWRLDLKQNSGWCSLDDMHEQRKLQIRAQRRRSSVAPTPRYEEEEPERPTATSVRSRLANTRNWLQACLTAAEEGLGRRDHI